MDIDIIVERRSDKTDWTLMRRRGSGTYFFITLPCGGVLGPMLHLDDVSRNFFQCRSVAFSIYDSFVNSLPEVIHAKNK